MSTHVVSAHPVMAAPGMDPVMRARVAPDSAVMPPGMMSAVRAVLGSRGGGEHGEQERAAKQCGAE